MNAATAAAIGGRAGGKHAQRVPTAPTRRPAAATGQGDTPAPSRSAGTSGAPATQAPTARPSDHGPGSSLRITGTAAVALTFDDGPDPVETPKILALLEQYHVKATFCLIGQNVEKNPEIVRQIVAAGHTLCNHTWNHSLTIGQDPPEQIAADLARTNTAIQAAVPGAEVPFFRAPGGDFTDRLVSVASAAGMTSLYWAVDPRDWYHPTGENDAAHVDRVIAEIRQSVQPGSIVLSHDFHQPDTTAAYAKLLPWLTEHFTIAVPERSVTAPATTPPSNEPTPADPTPPPPSPTPTVSPSPAPTDQVSSTE